MEKTIFLAITFALLSVTGKGQLLSSAKTSIDLNHACIVVDSQDHALVKRSAELLQADIASVTGYQTPILNKKSTGFKTHIIIGSLDKSVIIQELSKRHVEISRDLKNKWEAYRIQSIQQDLIITGSDRRGTAYGIFELSKQIGVSPWYWWADVPVQQHTSVYINPKVVIADAPKVKYRGIFINDEAPALSGWTKEKFGGFNHLFYEKVFELLLRLKANYLWPAMWGNAFYYDDSLNIKMADEYGIVIGTSHHEPLMRAHEEWKYEGKGAKWNYDSTESGLQAFWKKGMERAWNEKIVTVGMRGDGDEPMSRETATALLERIVKDQRKIIADITGKPAEQTPQLWALYKEVQDYYDKGMRVPDDVTLLLCDDNWGNLRKLPKTSDKKRKGGYGIYYHFDYVGGPRNYKWLNTNPLPRIWEQMNLAWEYDVKNIWIVNVGDIKPMELPISFFLDYAWNPERISEKDIQSYTNNWAASQFGPDYAREIGELLAQYAKINGRRKPELLDATTYSFNFEEWPSVVKQYKQLYEQAEHIRQQLPARYHDAFFQLVLHPIKACSNLHDMYYHVALNREAYQQKSAITNHYANTVQQLYLTDSLITLEYHRMNNGKWNHMMSQTHIGYTYWQQPIRQRMPLVKYVPADSIAERKASGSMSPSTRKAVIPINTTKNVFYQDEERGISINAHHYTKANNTHGITWKTIPDLGRSSSAITTFPVTAREQKPGNGSPSVEYEVYTYDTGKLTIQAHFSPTLNFHGTEEGLQYAISVDDEQPQVFSINKEDKNNISGIWNKWVSENIIIKSSSHQLKTAGRHVIKYWMVSPAVVLQKIVAGFNTIKQSYLGPPETIKP